MPAFDDRSRALAQQRQQQLRNDQVRRNTAAVERNRAQFQGFLDSGRQQRERERQRRTRAGREQSRQQQQRLRMRSVAPPKPRPIEPRVWQPEPIRTTPTSATVQASRSDRQTTDVVVAPPERGTAQVTSLISVLLTIALVSGVLLLAWWVMAARSFEHPLTGELEDLSARAGELNRRWDEGSERLDPGSERERLFAETRLGIEELLASSIEITARANAMLPPDTSAKTREAVDLSAGEVVAAGNKMLEGLLGPIGETTTRREALADFQRAIGELIAALHGSDVES